MTESSTLEQVNDVFRGMFGKDDMVLTRATRSEEVDGWDSLMHVNLVIAMEEHFGIRFQTKDIAFVQNVGELVDLIDSTKAP